MSEISKIVEPELINMDATLDKDDVIAIGVTQAEEYAQAELERCLQESEHHTTQAKKLDKQKHEQLKQHAAEKCQGDVDAAKAAAQSLGLPAVEVKTFSEWFDSKKKTHVVNFHVESEKTQKKTHCHLFVNGHRIVTVPKAILALHADAEKHMEQVKTLQSEAMKWKKRLTKIPQLERKLRGKLAQERLKKTAEGSAIVAALTSDIQREVLALPCR